MKRIPASSRNLIPHAPLMFCILPSEEPFNRSLAGKDCLNACSFAGTEEAYGYCSMCFRQRQHELTQTDRENNLAKWKASVEGYPQRERDFLAEKEKQETRFKDTRNDIIKTMLATLPNFHNLASLVSPHKEIQPKANTVITASLIATLTSLRCLVLSLQQTDMDSSCLFNSLPDLEHLALLDSSRRISEDSVLKHLSNLKKLRILDLSGRENAAQGIFWRPSNINEVDLAFVGEVKSLEHLSLANCFGLEDDSLKHIANLPNLKSLSLRGNRQLGNQSLVALKANTSLVALDLSGCSISNEGIPHLCEFTQLEALWLFNTNLNQEGIARLSCLKKLRFLATDEKLHAVAMDHILYKGTVILDRDQYTCEHCYHTFTARRATDTSKGKN